MLAQHGTASMHMPHVTFNFSFYQPSGQLTHFVHVTQTFTSSSPLTGRTDRLHLFQTFVPSHRAQVFHYSTNKARHRACRSRPGGGARAPGAWRGGAGWRASSWGAGPGGCTSAKVVAHTLVTQQSSSLQGGRQVGDLPWPVQALHQHFSTVSEARELLQVRCLV